MSQPNARAIVSKAIKKDELDLLLLGKQEYQYLPRWSPSQGNTDLPILLSAFYALVGKYPREELRDRLHCAIKKIVDSYEGLDPVASCILYESSECSPVDSFGQPTRQNPLGLPLEEIASALRQSIRVFSFRLEKDKSRANWPDGHLGILRRLSKNTERLGGPSFCD